MHTAHRMGRLLPIAVVGTAAVALATSPNSARADPEPASPSVVIDVPVPTRTVTLAQALSYAREHQPAIHEAMARVAARAQEAKVPSGQWLPTVGMTAQIFAMTANNTTATFVQPDFMDVPRIGGTASTSTGSFAPYASTFVGGGLLQELFDFGRIGAQRAAADALVDVEKHRADAARLDVDFNVEESFFAVFAAKSVVKAADDAYERARVHRDLAKRGVDAGLRSPIELTRAEADLARFHIGRIRARGGLAVAQSVLSAAIGAPDGAVDVTDAAPTAADLPTLPEALRLAQAREPRLAAALSDLAAAEKHTRAVGAELRPNLGATVTLSGRAGGAPPATLGASAVDDGFVPNVPNWDAGIVLSWPLFDGTIDARHKAARAEEQVRRADVEAAQEQEVAAVRESYVKVQVARSAVEALANAVVVARANYDQADARFRAGIGNAVELADAEAVRTDAEIQLALGQFEVARTRAQFGRTIAEGL